MLYDIFQDIIFKKGTFFFLFLFLDGQCFLVLFFAYERVFTWLGKIAKLRQELLEHDLHVKRSFCTLLGHIIRNEVLAAICRVS